MPMQALTNNGFSDYFSDGLLKTAASSPEKTHELVGKMASVMEAFQAKVVTPVPLDTGEVNVENLSSDAMHKFGDFTLKFIEQTNLTPEDRDRLYTASQMAVSALGEHVVYSSSPTTFRGMYPTSTWKVHLYASDIQDSLLKKLEESPVDSRAVRDEHALRNEIRLEVASSHRATNNKTREILEKRESNFGKNMLKGLASVGVGTGLGLGVGLGVLGASTLGIGFVVAAVVLGFVGFGYFMFRIEQSIADKTITNMEKANEDYKQSLNKLLQEVDSDNYEQKIVEFEKLKLNRPKLTAAAL